jgi:hypothetical protein
VYDANSLPLPQVCIRPTQQLCRPISSWTKFVPKASSWSASCNCIDATEILVIWETPLQLSYFENTTAILCTFYRCHYTHLCTHTGQYTPFFPFIYTCTWCPLRVVISSKCNKSVRNITMGATKAWKENMKLWSDDLLRTLPDWASAIRQPELSPRTLRSLPSGLTEVFCKGWPTHTDRPWESKATKQAASLTIKKFDGKVIVGSVIRVAPLHLRRRNQIVNHVLLTKSKSKCQRNCVLHRRLIHIYNVSDGVFLVSISTERHSRLVHILSENKPHEFGGPPCISMYKGKYRFILAGVCNWAWWNLWNVQIIAVAFFQRWKFQWCSSNSCKLQWHVSK